MRTSYIAMLIVCLVTSAASAKGILPEVPYNVVKMNQFIDQLKQMDQYPDQDSRPTERSNKPVPNRLREIFSNVQAALFGKDGVLSLESCERCFLQIEGKTVFASPDFFQKLEKANLASYRDPQYLIEFMIAHEVAHYAHELSVLRDGKSINGNKSCINSNSNSVDGARSHA